MAHLIVDLFDRRDSPDPFHTFDDRNEKNRELFHDLDLFGVADRTARVRVRTGGEYRVGDHLRLLDRVRRFNTGTLSIDPAVAADIDFHTVSVNGSRFADRAAAVDFVLNPEECGDFRLRVSLFGSIEQTVPSIILYDWEFPPFPGFADLNLFLFAHKAAKIRVDRGAAYRDGDRVVLWDNLTAGSPTRICEPGSFDLNLDGWADRVAGVEFDLVPPL